MGAHYDIMYFTFYKNFTINLVQELVNIKSNFIYKVTFPWLQWLGCLQYLCDTKHRLVLISISQTCLLQ